MPMRILAFPFFKYTTVSVIGITDSIALFATDEVIPGWSDVGPLAKVSILAALFSILSAVISYVIYSLFAAMKQQTRDSMQEKKEMRDALMAEIKNSRDAFGTVITNVRASAERQAAHSDSVLDKLNCTIIDMTAGCAAVQARMMMEHGDTMRTHDAIVEFGRVRSRDDQTRHDDSKQRHVDDRVGHDDAVLRNESDAIKHDDEVKKQGDCK